MPGDDRGWFDDHQGGFPVAQTRRSHTRVRCGAGMASGRPSGKYSRSHARAGVGARNLFCGCDDPYLEVLLHGPAYLFSYDFVVLNCSGMAVIEDKLVACRIRAPFHLGNDLFCRQRRKQDAIAEMAVCQIEAV